MLDIQETHCGRDWGPGIDSIEKSPVTVNDRNFHYYFSKNITPIVIRSETRSH